MRRCLSVLTLILLTATPAAADRIDFTQITMGPSGSLSIGGATITTVNDGGLVASVEGLGLGVAGVGLDGAIERTWNFLEGDRYSPQGGGSRDSNLRITVDGHISAMTVMPYMVIDGPLWSQGNGYFGLYMSVVQYSPVGDRYFILPPFVPRTIEFQRTGGVLNHMVHTIEAGTSPAADGFDPHFSLWRDDIDYAAATVTFGYSITSIEYEPVPEPASLLLLSTGAAGLAAHARRRKRQQRVG